jgi:hypothetical protein
MFEVWTTSIIIILMHSVRKPVERRKDLSVGISIEVIIFLLTMDTLHIWIDLKLVLVIMLAGSFRIKLTG